MWIYLIITLILLIFTYFKMQANSIKQRIESAGVHIPYFGNTTFTVFTNMLCGVSLFEFTLKQYNKVKQSGHKLALYTHLGSTTLEVRDPEILKHILVKDFEYFTERMSFTPSKSDWLMNKMLSLLKGDSWRALRGKLSPAFTSKKLRRLFTRFDQSGKELMKFLESEAQLSPGGEINIMTAFSKFTTDIIASAVCGIDARVYEGSSPSQFQEMGDKVLVAFTSMKTFAKLVIASILPARIIDAIGICMIDKEIRDFFGNSIRYSMANRAGKDEGRDDFLQLMLEARAGMLKLEENEMEVFERDAQLRDTSSIVSNSSLLDDDGIVSNCVQFIFAGLDSMQSHLIFITYELALNQDVQNKLRDEIVKTLNSTDDGKLTYEVIGGLVYLDMVINEALRRWSPGVQVNRVCVKNYKVPGTEFVLKKGEAINASIYGMHMDEDIFLNPENFDPERFAPENKSNINAYTFIPFGQGPRNCIGMRFAQIETKVAIAQLVKNFKIEPSKRTEIPLKLTGSFVMKAKNDIFLSFKKLN